jgi:hypothetical protein
MLAKVGTTILVMSIVIGASSNCEAQSGSRETQSGSPVVKVYAYEREVVGGIPGGPPGVGAAPRQKRYFIYLETSPKAEFAVETVWMKEQAYAVETSVKTTPVRFDSPVKLAQDEKSVAVPATSNTVTEIAVKDPVPGKAPDKEASSILRENAAAVQLRYAGKSLLVPIKKFEPRDPIYMR